MLFNRRRSIGGKDIEATPEIECPSMGPNREMSIQKPEPIANPAHQLPPNDRRSHTGSW
jgi:hypothetical protein